MKRRITSILLMTQCMSLILFSAVSAQAQETPAGIQISPVIFEHDLKPGDVQQETVRVSNRNPAAVDLSLEVADFYYDENGKMKFIEENQENSSVSSLKKWLSYDQKELTLAPNSDKDIPFTITVPANAEPGGHYGVMFFRTKQPDAAQIGISARVGALVLVTIPGDVKKTGELEDFIVGKMNAEKKVNTQNFFETGPVDMAFTLKNTGNAHFKPTGTITIKDTFGRVVKEIPMPPDIVRAFPEIPRTYAQTANIDPWGWYEASLSLKDGDGNALPPLTVKFWGMNYKMLLVWLLVVAVVIVVLVIGIKQYNKWIISKAKGK